MARTPKAPDRDIEVGDLIQVAGSTTARYKVTAINGDEIECYGGKNGHMGSRVFFRDKCKLATTNPQKSAFDTVDGISQRTPRRK